MTWNNHFICHLRHQGSSCKSFLCPSSVWLSSRSICPTEERLSTQKWMDFRLCFLCQMYHRGMKLQFMKLRVCVHLRLKWLPASLQIQYSSMRCHTCCWVSFKDDRQSPRGIFYRALQSPSQALSAEQFVLKRSHFPKHRTLSMPLSSINLSLKVFLEEYKKLH